MSMTSVDPITWVRSLVRDPAQRELLCELKLAMDRLDARLNDASSELDLLRKTHHNLMRMWAD